MPSRSWRSGSALLFLLFAAPLFAQSTPTVIQSGDAVNVTVVDQDALSQRYVVQPTGTVAMPLIGEVKAEGLTAEQFAFELRQRLAEFFTNPQVRAELEPVKRVFVFGAIRSPGAYELSPNLTLLEALSRAGYTGTAEVVIVRPKGVVGPAPENDPTAETIRVNLRALENDLRNGRLSRNVLLTAGDTIYVPKDNPNAIYVSGEVRKPGSYSLPEGTTVLQAVSLAGGVTEQGALGRVHIVRLVGSEQRDVSAKLGDALQPGDTVVVPQKIEFPVIEIGPSDPQNQAGRIYVGQAWWIRPTAALRRIGIDSNVFNTPQPQADFTIDGGPHVDTGLDLTRFKADARGDVDFVYFRQFANQRAVNRSGDAEIEVLPSRRVHLRVGASLTQAHDWLSAELDQRVSRLDRDYRASVLVQPWRRLEVELSGDDFDRALDQDQFDLGVNLRDTLTEHIQRAGLTTRIGLTDVTSLVLSGETATHRFALFPAKNADATEVSVGMLFKAGAVVTGEGHVGYLRYLERIRPDVTSKGPPAAQTCTGCRRIALASALSSNAPPPMRFNRNSPTRPLIASVAPSSRDSCVATMCCFKPTVNATSTTSRSCSRTLPISLSTSSKRWNGIHPNSAFGRARLVSGSTSYMSGVSPQRESESTITPCTRR